ncbi:MAG: hypothetical protein ACR2QE_04855, partial [Acidimicrobiales bacterium]
MPHRLMLVLLVAALGASACSDGTPAAGTTSVVESTTTIEAEPADDTVAPTLRVALVALEHLDPADQRITS